MNPPRSVEEVTKAITREIPKTNFMDTCEFPRLESLLPLHQKKFQSPWIFRRQVINKQLGMK